MRNEILRVSTGKGLLTNSHLDVEDPDTPPNELVYLVARPSNGILTNVHDLSTPIYNFTQEVGHFSSSEPISEKFNFLKCLFFRILTNL